MYFDWNLLAFDCRRWLKWRFCAFFFFCVLLSVGIGDIFIRKTHYLWVWICIWYLQIDFMAPVYLRNSFFGGCLHNKIFSFSNDKTTVKYCKLLWSGWPSGFISYPYVASEVIIVQLSHCLNNHSNHTHTTILS